MSPGDIVRVIDGEFKGFEGEIWSIANELATVIEGRSESHLMDSIINGEAKARLIHVPTSYLSTLAPQMDCESGRLVEAVKFMSTLTDEERLEVMSEFCFGCGCILDEKPQGTCHCQNDE